MFMYVFTKNVVGKLIPQFSPLVKKESLRTVILNWDENDNTSHEKFCLIKFFSKKIRTEIINRIKNAD